MYALKFREGVVVGHMSLVSAVRKARISWPTIVAVVRVADKKEVLNLQGLPMLAEPSELDQVIR
jgi:hypothetical protein